MTRYFLAGLATVLISVGLISAATTTRSLRASAFTPTTYLLSVICTLALAWCFVPAPAYAEFTIALVQINATILFVARDPDNGALGLFLTLQAVIALCVFGP